ncbi:MAG: GntR family transcriptional regulator [Calditrichia bacterium]
MNDIFKTIGSPRTLSQEVVRTIEENILNKKLMPGQKLPTEKELGEMFGVSRIALREAMQVLERQRVGFHSQRKRHLCKQFFRAGRQQKHEFVSGNQF